MIKLTAKNEKIMIANRDAEIDKLSVSDTDKKAYKESCIGLNFDVNAESCLDCSSKQLCMTIEDSLSNNMKGDIDMKKEENKKETKKETKKEENKKEENKKEETKKEETKKEENKKETKKEENKKEVNQMKEVEAVQKSKTVTIESVILKYDYSKLDADTEQLKTIKSVTKDIKKAQNSIVSEMVAMGEMLNRIKVLLKSNWLDWLAIELDMNANQAYSAINVYNRFGKKINQISNKIAYTTLGQLASDAFTDEEIEAVLKAVDHEKINGTMSSIQQFVKELRLVNDDVDNKKDDKEPKEKSEKSDKLDTRIDISEDDVSFKPYIKQSEDFLKILEASATVSEEQFNDLKKLKDIINQINDNMQLKLTEIVTEGK